MASYKTIAGDMLDLICFDFYGDENKVAEVLEANPGLADVAQPFASGLVIELPEQQAQTTANEAVRLWQ